MKNLQALCMAVLLSTATVSVCAADQPATTAQASISPAERPTTKEKLAELEARVKGLENGDKYNRFSFVMSALFLVGLITAFVEYRSDARQ